VQIPLTYRFSICFLSVNHITSVSTSTSTQGKSQADTRPEQLPLFKAVKWIPAPRKGTAVIPSRTRITEFFPSRIDLDVKD
jgi:hypothetical protein